MKTSEVFIIFFFLLVARTVYGDCPRPTGGPNTQLITDLSFPAPEGTTVTFSCEVGYRRLGSGAVTCSGGQWTTLNMRCEKRNCGSAGEVNGQGHVDYYEGTEFGAFAKVVCDPGFMAVGADKTIYCGVNGWEGRLQECEVIRCDAPNPIENGYFSPMNDDFGYSEVITYGCDGDYFLDGSSTASCHDDGQLKPAPPKCVSVNCPNPKVTGGMVVAGTFQPPYKHQSSVTLRCNRGHTLQGQSTVSCDINSKWSPPLPVCNAITCKSPVISNGEVVDDSGLTYKFEETVTLKCDKGYRLKGPQTVKCEAQDQWSPALPHCTLIQCPAPEVKHGFIVDDPQPPYTPQDTVTFKCESGYHLKGAKTVTCEENSQWYPKLPHCTQVLCRVPEVKHGQVVEGSSSSYRFSESVVFECKSGYRISGASVLTCGGNSQWLPELPQCKRRWTIWEIILIVLGVIALIIIIIIIIYCLCFKNRDSKRVRGVASA